MIVVAEPTYADGEHAAINAALLQGLGRACGDILFAATPLHHARVREAAPSMNGVVCRDIAVLPPGGVQLRRMRAQWRVLDGLVRTHGATRLVLLSAGPETLFVTRALVARHAGLQVFAVMHGNLAGVTGWRSRDPRRRMIDLRSGLAMARHPRIHLIVLEPHIRDAAAEAGLSNAFLIWPHPAPTDGGPAGAAWEPGPRLRLAFVGTANRVKGFDDFLALHQALGPAYDWSVTGHLSDEYDPSVMTGIEHSTHNLPRAEFLGRVRAADFAIMAFRPEYRFIASGSLLDCVTQRKPLIAVRNPMLTALAERYGPPGYLCGDLDAVQTLLSDPARLRDTTAYAGFQRALDAMHQDRTPEALAPIVRRDLQC